MKTKIVVFTGAGVSAESGIATFRDSDGMWENYNVMEVCSTRAMKETPQVVYDFYNARRADVEKAEPNAAHKAIAALEDLYDVTVVTQNVDDLHERGGSTKVLHLHGELMKKRCLHTHKVVPYFGDLTPESGWRPHIVMFGEMLYNYEGAEQAIKEADVGIVIGTSLEVYPAAGLIYDFKISTPVIVVDPKPTIDEFTFPNAIVRRMTAVQSAARLAGYVRDALRG